MAIVCNCPAKCEIHPKPKLADALETAELKKVQSIVGAPKIDFEDKLTLKILEAESLKSQIDAQRAQQQLIQRVQLAHQQLEQFTAAMFEKHGLKQSEWVLDLAKLEFVAREK